MKKVLLLLLIVAAGAITGFAQQTTTGNGDLAVHTMT
jgi:hypothetical protein